MSRATSSDRSASSGPRGWAKTGWELICLESWIPGHAREALPPTERPGSYAVITWRLHRPDHVQEEALVVVAQVRQVVREIREVIAGTDLEMLAQVAVDGHHGAGTGLVDVGQIERAGLDQPIPDLVDPQVGPQDKELRRVVKELAVLPVQADLAQPVGVLAADRPRRGEVVVHVDGRHV